MWRQIIIGRSLRWFMSGLGLLCLLASNPNPLHATHKCPKPPVVSSGFGLFFTTTYLPIASSMASTKSMNTLGCQDGHPSKSFYKPKPRNQVYQYLQENLEYVKEEVSTGEGQHLEALSVVVGCSRQVYPVFAQTMHNAYSRIFTPSNDPDPHARITDELLEVVFHNHELYHSCAEEES
ncbi:MAG: DUF3015 family protein [SAR324 cluster bacterium]|nr:DUF3015 family protein [SAR324 cluster bacterium]